MSRTFDTQFLLSHTGWLRVLAAELTGDAHRAEDVAQETWLAALAHPPRDAETDGNLRAWLAAVARNLARLSVRTERRRAAREEASAWPEAVPSVASSVERAARQRELLDAVLALPPEDREAVVLRYFEELRPREIAVRLGTTSQAVRSRLTRSLKRLRERLDREHGGDRRAWLSTFLSLSAPPAPAGAWTLGIVLMKLNAKLLIACCLAALAVPVVWLSLGDGAASVASRPESAVATPGGNRPPGPGADGTTPARVEAAAPEAEPVEPPASPGVANTITGKVIDPTGSPVAGIAVRLCRGDTGRSDGGEPAAATDAMGRFSLPAPGAAGRIEAGSDSYVTLLGVPVGPGLTSAEAVIVVAPRNRYAGIVVDQAGAPLAGVHLGIMYDPDMHSRLSALRPGLANDCQSIWTATSAADGAFEFGDMGWIEGLNLAVGAEGFVRLKQVLPSWSVTDMRLVLERVEARSADLIGRVVDSRGEPIETAQVLCGDRYCLTGRDGGFILERPQGEGDGSVLAVREGYLPARAELDEGSAPAGTAADPLILVLEGTPLTIAGRVLDAAGRPVPGALVWTEDGTPIRPGGGRVRGMYEKFVEDLLSVRHNSLESGRRRQADEIGAFELVGLLPRSYTLMVLHPWTLEVAVASAIAAGSSGVLLTLPGGEYAPRVAGRVVSFSGCPIPNATIHYGRAGSIGGASYESAPWYLSPLRATADAEGRFAFESLCVNGAWLLARGDGVGEGDRRFALDSRMELDHLEIRVPLEVEFQVFLESDPTEADSLHVVDGDGVRLSLTIRMGNTLMGGSLVQIQDGHTAVITTDERARTLILYRERTEVRRVPLDLTPGEVRVLRL